MNPNNLISIITNKARYPETNLYVAEIRKRNENISRVSIEAIKQILSKQQYKAKNKLFALRFLKDCFEQADPYFIKEVEVQILPLLAKIIRDSTQSQSFTAYSEKQYESQSELISFKSQLFSMFICCQQCVKNWALWMLLIKRKQNPYMVLKSSLEAERIHFPIQNKYFEEKNQQNFLRNYQNIINEERKQQTISISKQPLILPTYSSKESRYSKKLDLILIELFDLTNTTGTAQYKRSEIDRLSNVFEQVIGNYMSSTAEFDQKFVNEYYSRLQTIIKQIQQKCHNIADSENIQKIKYSSVNSLQSESSVIQDPYLIKINHPPRLARQLPSLFFPKYQNYNANLNNNKVGLQKEQSILSNISKSSSNYPPIRIPSTTSYPISQIANIQTNQAAIIESTPIGFVAQPSSAYLPSQSRNVEQIKYQTYSHQGEIVKKNVQINENINQIKQYQNSSPAQSNMNYSAQNSKIINHYTSVAPKMAILNPSSLINNEYYPHYSSSKFPIQNQNTSQQVIFPPNMKNYANKQHSNDSINKRQQLKFQLQNAKINDKILNQNILVKQLLRQRRQNFQLSQHMLSLELKMQMLQRQIQEKQKSLEAEKLFYRSHSNSNLINVPRFNNDLLQRAKSNTFRTDDNFFRQQQLVHSLEIRLKHMLGWTNISKFKLAILGAGTVLYKDSKIKVTVASKQMFNKGVLCLEHILKIKTKSKHQSIQLKYKSSKQFNLWTKPCQYNSQDEIHQQTICSVVQTPLPIVQANVLLDGLGVRIVLPVLLINFLVSGDVSSDRFRSAFLQQQRYIVNSKINHLNPAIVPKLSVFQKYFICAQQSPKKQKHAIQAALLFPNTQTLLLLEIQFLNNQRAVFRVLQVGCREKQSLAKELMDNLIFLFST